MSVGIGAATTGRHGDASASQRAASSTKTQTGVIETGARMDRTTDPAIITESSSGQTVRKDTDQNLVPARDAGVQIDSDRKIVSTIRTAEEDELLRSPGIEKNTGKPSTSGSRTRRGDRRKMGKYKAAIKIAKTIGKKADRTRKAFFGGENSSRKQKILGVKEGHWSKRPGLLQQNQGTDLAKHLPPGIAIVTGENFSLILTSKKYLQKSFDSAPDQFQLHKDDRKTITGHQKVAETNYLQN